MFGCNFWKGDGKTRVVFEVNQVCAECRWFLKLEHTDTTVYHCGRRLPNLAGGTHYDRRRVPVITEYEKDLAYTQVFGCNFWESKEAKPIEISSTPTHEIWTLRWGAGEKYQTIDDLFNSMEVNDEH
jgi:hypothetical protein